MNTPLPPWRIKLIRTVLGLPALAVGILLAWAGYFHQMEDHEKVASWVKTPCRILSWGVNVSQSSFGLKVQPVMSFEYAYGGKTYRSSNYDEATDWLVDLRDFEAEGHAARRGPAYCYVNPDKPAEASFRAARLWFPFSLIGGGAALALAAMVFLILTYIPRRIRPYDRDGMQGRVGRRVLGGMALFLIGLGVYQLWQFNLVDKVYAQVVRSQLIRVPARVEGTGIVEERGSGRHYNRRYQKAHLVYSYEHGGRRWHSDRWYFDARRLDVGSKETTRAMLARYPAGLEMGIWILPDKPWYSTLDPGLRWDFLWLILPVGFISGGLWLLGDIRRRR
ncbi:DUF3592 domain-containing protein [Prosthecobacter sp. SYSU 5D2]|uniref:DUF3592 domain-containing protein n=1 Tax=Prosthecobacter sp. SYSU 5D2 TaxID=3134134 RepID=UPI0031FE9F89